MNSRKTKSTLYHNPCCSKSRAALTLLQERGINPTIIEYLKTPPTAEDIKSLLKALAIPPNALLRNKEKAYTQANLTPQSTLDQIVIAIAQHPILLERPILQHGPNAIIGRPTERLQKFLEEQEITNE